MRRGNLCCLALLVAASGLTLGDSTGDRVELYCAGAAPCPSGTENGVLLVAKTVTKAYRTSDSIVPLGDRVDDAYTQVVAFRAGSAPALAMSVDWSQTDSVKLQFGAPVEIPVKVWVLCVNANCEGPLTEGFRDKINTFLFNANGLLEQERVGIILKKAATDASGGDWISDQTGNSAKRYEFRDFEAEGDDDDCSKLDQLTGGMKEEPALNMYVVGRVAGSAWEGYSCGEMDIAVVAAATSWHTKLHEIGHNFGLEHVDARTIRQYTPTENLMHKASSDRRFLSEGQVFRMNFDIQTAMNQVFFALAPDRPFRDCTGPDVACPPQGTWIWDDKD